MGLSVYKYILHHKIFSFGFLAVTESNRGGGNEEQDQCCHAISRKTHLSLSRRLSYPHIRSSSFLYNILYTYYLIFYMYAFLLFFSKINRFSARQHAHVYGGPVRDRRSGSYIHGKLFVLRNS